MLIYGLRLADQYYRNARKLLSEWHRKSLHLPFVMWRCAAFDLRGDLGIFIGHQKHFKPCTAYNLAAKTPKQ